MLTKTDLQNIDSVISVKIKKIVRDEITREGKLIRSELRHEIKLMRMELSNRIDDVEKRLGNIEIDTTQIKKDIKKIKKDLTYSVDFLDEDYLVLKARIKNIEGQLPLRA